MSKKKKRKKTKKQKVEMTKMLGKRKTPSKYEIRLRKRQKANREAGLPIDTPSPIRQMLKNKEA